MIVKIEKFIAEINNCRNIKKVSPMITNFLGVPLYFGDAYSLKFLDIKKGIIIFWDDDKLILSPIFKEEYNICSSCFLEWKELLKKRNDNIRKSEILVTKDPNFFEDKIKIILTQLLNIKATPPFFDYFIFEDSQIKRETFFRVSQCDYCISSKEFDYSYLKDRLEKNKVMASSLRTKIIDFSKLVKLDNRDTGLFTFESTTFLKNSFSVELQLPTTNEQISGIGIDDTYSKAKTKAFLEALERYCGIFSKGSERFKYSLKELSNRNINFYNPNNYLVDIGKNQINANQKIYWILGFDYETQKNILIPEDFIIYKTERTSKLDKIINMSSNGHAVGANYDEAIIFSLFEMYERDNFLLFWYEERIPKEVDQETIDDGDIEYYIKLIKSLGYDIYIYQLHTNHLVNVYWTFARGKTRDKFATYSTAGGHFYSKTAIISGLKELYFALVAYNEDIKNIKIKALNMKEENILTVSDHAIYYSIEDRIHNFDFLKYAEKISYKRELDYELDQEKYCKKLLQYTENLFGKIIIVDNTPIGIKEIGLSEVKVFVPNMQDMSFGYENQFINKKRINVGINKKRPPHPFP